MLNKKYWRQDLTTEACLQILSLGFNTLGLEHIKSGHDTGHTASGSVLKKIGMSFEHVTENTHELNDKMVDTFFSWHN